MAWTTPRTWVTSEVVTAATMNVHIRDNFNALRTVYKVKAADESVTSSVTLQNDDDLFFPVAANESWVFEILGWWTQAVGSSGGFKWTCTGPTGSSGAYGALLSDGSSVQGIMDSERRSLGTTNSISPPSFTLQCGMHFWGHILNGSTAGNLNFQWAQSSSSGNATRVLADSFLIAHLIV